MHRGHKAQHWQLQVTTIHQSCLDIAKSELPIMPVITPSTLSLSIHLPSSCLIRPMQPCGHTPHHPPPRLSWKLLGHFSLPLTHVASWGSLLWCWLCLPGIIHVVVVGVLLGVGCIIILLIETLLVF